MIFRKCVLGWKIPEVSKLFESLHALANLLVVVPENLNEACSSQLLVHFILRRVFVVFVCIRFYMVPGKDQEVVSVFVLVLKYG